MFHLVADHRYKLTSGCPRSCLVFPSSKTLCALWTRYQVSNLISFCWYQQHLLEDAAGCRVSLKESLLSTSGFSRGGICLPKHTAHAHYGFTTAGGNILNCTKLKLIVTPVTDLPVHLGNLTRTRSLRTKHDLFS